MYNKKRILFISLGTCLLLLITAIFFAYYQKNSIKKLDDFASYLENYKLELANYSLIDNQKNYDNLITKSEQSISNKDYKNINSLKSELGKLKEGILNKNNDIIVNFSKYLEQYKNEISNYNLNDNQESYNNLIAESEQALSDKIYKNIDSLISKLNQLKEVIINKNIEAINNKLSELESIDISKISDKDFITSQFEEIKKLKEQKQFIKATELLNTLKEDIAKELEFIKTEKNNDNSMPSTNIELIKYVLPDYTITDIFPVEKVATNELGFPYKFIKNTSINDVFEVTTNNSQPLIAHINTKNNLPLIIFFNKEMLTMDAIADSFNRIIDNNGAVTGTKMSSNSNIMHGEVPIEKFR